MLEGEIYIDDQILLTNIFADPIGDGKYSPHPLLFNSDIIIKIPPIGWHPNILTALDYPKETAWYDWGERDASQLLGLSSDIINKYNNKLGITFSEWLFKIETEGLEYIKEEHHKRFAPKISRFPPTGLWSPYGKDAPSDVWLRRVIGYYMYKWAESYALSSAIPTSLIINSYEFQKETKKGNKLKEMLAREALCLSIPRLARLSLAEIFDLRSEIKTSLEPFWRVIRRISGKIILSSGQIDDEFWQNREEEIKSIIDSELGCTLEAYSSAISSDISHAYPFAVNKVKKWGQPVLKIIAGILKKDLEKITETIFDIPTEPAKPRNVSGQDIDITIRMLYSMRQRYKQLYKLNQS